MKYYLLNLVVVSALLGCSTMNEEALYSAMKKNPEKFMRTLNEVAESAAKNNMAKMHKEIEQQREKDLLNPRPVKIDDSRLIFGEKNAPVVIVKYADFQCPACRMGYITLEEIKKKYKGQIKVIHKNIPLPMHPQAPLAAEIYEAMLINDKALAKKFYNEAYEKLGQWNSEEKLWKLAKSVGIKKEKVLAELKKGVVAQRLKEDLEEHQRLGFQGTPMYMVNGVEMQGAPSYSELSQLIDKILNKK
jgi:protein-disulfide isomerase